MKNTLLTALLFICGTASAQIVNIPDPEFKNFLLEANTVNYLYAYDAEGSPITIDANGNGEIEVSEAQEVVELNLALPTDPSVEITSVTGIEAFTNLVSLDCSSTSIASLNITALTQLEELWAQDCVNLTILNVAGLSSLKTMTLNHVNLTTLDLSGLSSLETLWISADNLTSLDLSPCENLVDLTFYDAEMLTDITIGSKPLLSMLQLTANNLTSVDLSGCPALNTLILGVDAATYINLKNGDSDYIENNVVITMYDGQNESIQRYICIDEGEEYIFGEFQIGSNVTYSNYCTLTPGGEYNVMNGSVLFDGYGSGCEVSGSIIKNVRMVINDSTETATYLSNTGTYEFFPSSGTFTVAPAYENDWFTFSPEFAEVTFTEVDSLVHQQHFCIQPNGNHPDLDIVIVPSNGANPGFNNGYYILYTNKGNQAMSGDIVFTYADSIMDFDWANPTQSSSGNGTITWSYSDLQPFRSGEIYVEFNLNGPMETPAVNNGDELQFEVSITPNESDETPSNNSFVHAQIVEGSFDPNDITCLEGSTVDSDMIGEYLHYNINFENTGDAPAAFIVVKNMINETQFDVSTLQLLSASHDVELRTDGNKVEFFFDDIQLGPLEKGNVVFRIRTLNTLQVNDEVTQQADIFFDYNWPIQTNEATTVFAILGSSSFELDASVKVYPNPATALVTIEAGSDLQSVQLYDMAGRLLQTGLINGTEAKIDLNSRAAGFYFIKAETNEGIHVEKVIKQ